MKRIPLKTKLTEYLLLRDALGSRQEEAKPFWRNLLSPWMDATEVRIFELNL